MAKLERDFQAEVIRELKTRFPDCIVLKTDPNYIQGIPDLLVLHNGNWAALECKRSRSAVHRPNQDYYITKLNELSFARIIFPENREDVLYELCEAFGF